ncbi:hypothetical protein HJD18_10625 [Thermoleophilia bacterium SCSIO 60948]|nr:hypothetical protein HJD18_10625 [Thermoleophilia bacterium SCSIO 60948]
MSSENNRHGISEPSELIYEPASSYKPLFMAAAIAGIVVGIFAGTVYLVVGAIVAIVTLVLWANDTRDEIVRMPRRQRTTTAVLPATPLRRRSR